MYPEHEKLMALKGHNNTVGEFLEWLSQNGVSLCTYQTFGRNDWDGPTGYWPDGVTITDRLAAFFEIDTDKLESEKRAMLDSIRELN